MPQKYWISWAFHKESTRIGICELWSNPWQKTCRFQKHMHAIIRFSIANAFCQSMHIKQLIMYIKIAQLEHILSKHLIQWLNYHSHWLFSCASFISKLCLFAASNIFLNTLVGWSLRLRSSSRSLLFFLRNQFLILFSFHPFILSTCFLLQSLFWFFTIATFSFMLRPFTFFFYFEKFSILVNFKQNLHLRLVPCRLSSCGKCMQQNVSQEAQCISIDR